ncbi:MAG: acetate/propionate family kinase [Rudaea sp.]
MTADGRGGAARGGIVVINAGSSSIKFGLYDKTQRSVDELARGEIENLAAHPHLVARDASGSVLTERRWGNGERADLDALLHALLQWIGGHLGRRALLAAGHRVALGGLDHTAPAIVDRALVDRLHELVPLAPLHLPRNLEPIEILARLHPGLPQVACFDTAFHRTIPPVAQLYGLPRHVTEAGARRYGFHGLSYEFIAGALREASPAAATGRTIVAHLGSGASMCALLDGRSVATTMGFSPLSGIMMATRPGDVDPGILLWLVGQRGMDAKRVEAMLYRECGLLGVSGISDDMRVLLASDDSCAKEAIDLFVYGITREVGSLAAAIGGLDALVFTAGIGQNAPAVRAAVCRHVAWLGVEIDDDANARGGPRISAPGSSVEVWVLPTDEELMVARHTAALVAAMDESTA